MLPVSPTENSAPVAHTDRDATTDALTDAQTDAVRSSVVSLVPTALADLRDLVAVPSVSAAAFDQSQVERSAEAVAALFCDAGMPEVEVLRARRPDGSAGAPAVVARRPAPAGAPTVLLYAHHDVQPPGRDEQWTSPAFEPTERDGRLYGRGAADDKAGVCAHLTAVRSHLQRHGAGSGVGITVFVEGEEEIGSPSFGDFLATYSDRLQADVVVVADSTNAAVGLPALTTTLRGMLQAVVEVSTLDHALHSGMFGGAAPDPLALLLRMLASLWDDTGAVAVAGLPPAPEHAARAVRAQAGWPAGRFREEAGVLDGVELAGSAGARAGTAGDGPDDHVAPDDDVAPRVWAGPAVTVIGIDGPDVAHASNTMLPSARARISLRVPPGADPATAFEALRAHLLAVPSRGARVSVQLEELGHGYAADTATAGYAAARAALAQAWGTEPVDIGVGGSIPFIADLASVLPDAAVLVTGVEDPDSRAHGVDESLHLAEFGKACLAEALLLEYLVPAR